MYACIFVCVCVCVCLREFFSVDVLMRITVKRLVPGLGQMSIGGRSSGTCSCA